MRPRSQTTTFPISPLKQQSFLAQQYQKTKIQLSILQAKYQQIQSQRNILKQGNSHLIQQFLFNKHHEDLNKTSREVTQLGQQNEEFKKLIADVQNMLKDIIEQSKENKKHKFQYNDMRKFSIKADTQRNISTSRSSSLGHELKRQVSEIGEYCSKLKIKTVTLQEQNFKVKQQMQRLKIDIDNKMSVDVTVEEKQHEGKDGMTRLKRTGVNQQKGNDVIAKQEWTAEKNRLVAMHNKNEQQSATKIDHLRQENTRLSQQVQQLTTELAELKHQQHQQAITYTTLTSTQPHAFHTMPMTISQCHTEQLQRSIIYDQLSQSAFMQQSIVTESYDKRVSKLQKINNGLEKDYQLAKEKIKTMNREYSRLKLDYLKVEDERKREVEMWERKFEGVSGKVEMMARKVKEQEGVIARMTAEREVETQKLKATACQLQATITELQQQLALSHVQIQLLEEKLAQQQSQNSNIKQLQNEKHKTAMLTKEIETKTLQFQKSLMEYETIVEELRRLNGNGQGRNVKSVVDKSKDDGVKGPLKRATSRSLLSRSSTSRNKLSTSRQHHPQPQVITKHLQQQLAMAYSSLSQQTQRYNILQHSNKELRQRLIKMIESEEKLRKQLVGERVKSRTNKSVSSKYSVKAGSVVKVDGVRKERKGSQMVGEEEVEKRERMATDRSFQELLGCGTDSRVLYQSSSSRELTSLSLIQPHVDNIINKPTSSSYLKTMRERRFDPKETLLSKTIRQPNTDIVVNTSSLLSNSSLVSKNSSMLPYNEHEGKMNQSPTSDHHNTSYQPTYSNVNKTTSNIIQRSPPSPQSPTKYTYQPPQPKRQQSITKLTTQPSPVRMPSPRNKQQSQLSEQPNTDNQQITLQISQSMSNLSRHDKVIELSDYNDHLVQGSPFVTSFVDIGQKDVTKFDGEKYAEEMAARDKGNFVMAGKGQETRSSAEVRFVRKS